MSDHVSIQSWCVCSISARGSVVAAGTLQVTSQMFCRRRGRLEPYGRLHHVTHQYWINHTHTAQTMPAAQDTTIVNINTGRFHWTTVDTELWNQDCFLIGSLLHVSIIYLDNSQIVTNEPQLITGFTKRSLMNTINQQSLKALDMLPGLTCQLIMRYL